ncbi:E3 SUMO-protein ligase PIAS2-like isoform X1 [Centruroides sculpturatus]|uniref:E3 SUMO-protein ligase PIAS2-like isoform X1 n=2 Tax=Centruroides sculpturatus TaxID=218467 RepID=UPI000C6EBF05|nr:E3 SUMO-protein ligase PIAS2-like isoform X1 [Centruroides sculpturatus]
MSDRDELEQMILYFRVSELQVLLGFAGRNKSGKKQELQARALDLLKLRSAPIQMKIRELHKRRFPGASMAASTDSNDPSLMCSMNQAASQLKTNPYSMIRTGLPPPPTLHPTTAIGYPTSGGKQLPPTVPTNSGHTSYPVHPDVRLKPLPFYDILAELLKPASLMPSGNGRFQENNFQFFFTPKQAGDIAMSRDLRPGAKNDYSVQVQLRFCLLETSCEQDDNFPPSICVKVNQKMCPLPNPIPTNKPGVEPKRPSRPVNITGLCKLSPTHGNTITVSWASEYGRAYAVAVYLVQRLGSSTLLQRLKASEVRNPDHTKAMIKEKLQHDPDSEIATTSLRGSLICPLGKMRMQIPCRAITCTHLQCFDASLYLQMNEKKPTWICPVCDKPATFKNLVIDGLFMEITTKAPSDCTEVQFHEDGSWTPLLHKKETHVINTSVVQHSPPRLMSPQTEKKKTKVEVIDLTLESSSEDEAEQLPPPPRRHQPLMQQLPVSHPPTTSSCSMNQIINLPSPSIQPSSTSVTPLISLPSPSATSSPSSSSNSSTASSSSSSSSGASFVSVINPALSTISSATSSPQSSIQLTNPLLSMTARPPATTSAIPASSGLNLNTGPVATSTPTPSMPSSSLYSNIPVINSGAPSYYPQATSSFSDYISTAPPLFNYPNFDLFSLLQSTETDREVPYSTVPSAVGGRKASSTTPDVISLD